MTTAIQDPIDIALVKSPEDSVLRKLLWYRDGGRSVGETVAGHRSILRVSQAAMDETYLSSWAGRLRCEDLLARATANAAVVGE